MNGLQLQLGATHGNGVGPRSLAVRLFPPALAGACIATDVAPGSGSALQKFMSIPAGMGVPLSRSDTGTRSSKYCDASFVE